MGLRFNQQHVFLRTAGTCRQREVLQEAVCALQEQGCGTSRRTQERTGLLWRR